ncbi:acyl-CoA thioesterase [Nocardia sp. NPDC088792]|uniref:acyl-CoA thioesterase n=1 Tax=Nocardia sp. NPDC088792 TaxID=3364332 RepID=UPI003806CDD9
MHSYDIQLRRADMDALGHLNNVVFAQYLDEAREDLLAGHEPWHLVVAGHRLTYRLPLTFGPDPVTVTSVVERIGDTSFTLAHEVRNAEHVYLSATSTLVAMADNAPRSLTAAERAYLGALGG